MQVKKRVKKKPVYPVGRYIAAKRTALGMQQIELATRIGANNSAVSNWECEENNPGCEFFPRLADVFGCTIDELYGYIPASVPNEKAEFLRLLDELDDHDREVLKITMHGMAARHK